MPRAKRGAIASASERRILRSVGQEGNPSCDEAEPWRSEEQAGFSRASTTRSLREIVATDFDPGATACEAGGGALDLALRSARIAGSANASFLGGEARGEVEWRADAIGVASSAEESGCDRSRLLRRGASTVAERLEQPYLIPSGSQTACRDARGRCRAWAEDVARRSRRETRPVRGSGLRTDRADDSEGISGVSTAAGAAEARETSDGRLKDTSDAGGIQRVRLTPSRSFSAQTKRDEPDAVVASRGVKGAEHGRSAHGEGRPERQRKFVRERGGTSPLRVPGAVAVNFESGFLAKPSRDEASEGIGFSESAGRGSAERRGLALAREDRCQDPAWAIREAPTGRGSRTPRGLSSSGAERDVRRDEGTSADIASLGEQRPSLATVSLRGVGEAERREGCAPKTARDARDREPRADRRLSSGKRGNRGFARRAQSERRSPRLGERPC